MSVLGPPTTTSEQEVLVEIVRRMDTADGERVLHLEHHHVSVRFHDERRRLAARQIQAAATPIFDAVRALVPYGRSGMWGSLADRLAGSTMYAEQRRLDGGDPASAWAGVDALLDDLARQVPELRIRPRRQLISWSGGIRHQSVRGTCCLYYKTCIDPDPSGDGYCSTCPHRPDQSRAERITRWLEGQRT